MRRACTNRTITYEKKKIKGGVAAVKPRKSEKTRRRHDEKERPKRRLGRPFGAGKKGGKKVGGGGGIIQLLKQH